ncbi:MAG: AAA family ATPase [Bacteroidales bacterium]|nr:AAA family ATPase [Bacteroidales bacterium]
MKQKNDKEIFFGLQFPADMPLSKKDKYKLAKLLFISPTTGVNEVKSILGNTNLISAISRLIEVLNCELESVDFTKIDESNTDYNAKSYKKKFKAWQKEFKLPTLDEITELLIEKNIAIKGIWADIYNKCKSRNFNSPEKHFEYLSEYIIGQENAIKTISLLMHQQKIKSADNMPLPKNAILLIGKTGTGKSYLVNKSRELLGVPLQRINCASLVPAGIVGQTIEKYLTTLYISADASKKLTSISMLHFDEIDKLSTIYHSDDALKSTIQLEILRFFDQNEKIYFPDSHRQFSNLVSIPTDNLMLVFSGTFSGIDKIILKRLMTENITDMSLIDTNNILQYCTTQDIVDYGIIPELVARISLISPLNQLSEDDIYNILRYAKDSIYKQHLNKCKSLGLNITFTDDALKKIAEMAVLQNIGVRALNSVFNNLLSDFYFDIDNYKKTKIVINDKTVTFLLQKQILQPIIQAFKKEKDLCKIAFQFNSDINSILDIYSQWKKFSTNNY